MKARRYAVGPEREARVHAQPDTSAPSSQVLPAGTIVVVAEIAAPKAETCWARISSPQGWIEAGLLVDAPSVSRFRFDRATFGDRHLEVTSGERYGLAFPFTIEMLEKQGAAFLTEAFRASGVLPADNRVVSIERIEPYHGGQASDKAFLDVRYERPTSDLDTALFVKIPSSDPERKFFLADTVPFEVDFARISSKGDMPIEVPRYYFGDYSARTSNFILITDRVRYGENGIAAPCEKGFDHLLPDAKERYLVLARALAALAATHKSGDLGLDVETLFPFAHKAGTSRTPPDAEAKLDILVDFVSRRAPQIFPAWATKSDFLERLRQDILFGLEHIETLALYVHSDVDYVGLCHPNLNLDNAWFWNDETGKLKAGLLDWGMTRQMSFAQALSGMLMFPEPEIYHALVRDVTRAFASEFELLSGRRLDEETLRRQFKVSLFLSTIGMILGIVVDQFAQFSDEEYRSMDDRFDHRLQESGLSAGIIWLWNVLEEWNDELTAGDACREVIRSASR